MAVTDLKVSFWKKNTDFETDGFRMLPVTKKEYVEGLLGADGKIDPSLIPAWLWEGRVPAGIADLLDEANGGMDIHNIFIDPFGFDMSTPPDVSVQGYYVEVTTAGELVNESVNAARYELIGAGNQGDKTFPLILQTGDYIVLVKVDTVTPKYSFAIVDNTYGDATTSAKGIVMLYNGVDSASTTLVPTAGALKTTYDLAFGKEDAFTKNTAFNKDFTTSGGTNGVATTVARGDHSHGTYDRGTSPLTGTNVFSDIVVADGIVGSISSRTFSASDFGTGPIDDGVNSLTVVWSGSYLTTQFSNVNSAASDAANAAAVADKRGLKYYTSVANADAGGHNTGDIVAILTT